MSVQHNRQRVPSLNATSPVWDENTTVVGVVPNMLLDELREPEVVVVDSRLDELPREGTILHRVDVLPRPRLSLVLGVPSEVPERRDPSQSSIPTRKIEVPEEARHERCDDTKSGIILVARHAPIERTELLEKPRARGRAYAPVIVALVVGAVAFGAGAASHAIWSRHAPAPAPARTPAITVPVTPTAAIVATPVAPAEPVAIVATPVALAEPVAIVAPPVALVAPAVAPTPAVASEPAPDAAALERAARIQRASEEARERRHRRRDELRAARAAAAAAAAAAAEPPSSDGLPPQPFE